MVVMLPKISREAVAGRVKAPFRLPFHLFLYVARCIWRERVRLSCFSESQGDGLLTIC